MTMRSRPDGDARCACARLSWIVPARADGCHPVGSAMTTEHAPAKPAVDAEASAADAPLSALIERRGPRRRLEPSVGRAPAPDLVGLALLDAQHLARTAGFSVTVAVWETKVGPWGQVLSQQPMSGTMGQAGTPIHVVVAGRPHVTLPDLRGLDAHTAVGELRRLGLVPGGREERRSMNVLVGSVIATRPTGGSLVVDGSSVVLIVSHGRPSPPRARPSPPRGRPRDGLGAGPVLGTDGPTGGARD